MRLTALLLCLATPAAAMNDMEEMQAASTLGSLLASEKPCKLTYDQTAVAAWITANIPPERIGFASQLQMMTMGQGMFVDGLTGSGLTAHCTSVAQSARHLGFTK
jgi:hypothetical protein